MPMCSIVLPDTPAPGDRPLHGPEGPVVLLHEALEARSLGAYPTPGVGRRNELAVVTTEPDFGHRDTSSLELPTEYVLPEEVLRQHDPPLMPGVLVLACVLRDTHNPENLDSVEKMAGVVSGLPFP